MRETVGRAAYGRGGKGQIRRMGDIDAAAVMNRDGGTLIGCQELEDITIGSYIASVA